jgi:hypothetical protein
MTRGLPAIFMLAACLVPAQEPGPRQQAVEAIDIARTGPVEILADVAFRLMESSLLSADFESQVLEEIYRRAGEAQQPYPLRLTATAAIGRNVWIESAGRYQLDALSLRCRAIQRMSGSDPRKARQWFDEMPPLDLPKSTCEDVFVPDPAIFFETLALIVREGGYTPEERRKGEPTRVAERRLREVHRALAASAAVKSLTSIIDAGADADTVVAAIGAALDTTDDGDRAYRLAMRETGWRDDLRVAASKTARHEAAATALLTSFDGWAKRQDAAARCKGGVAQRPSPNESAFDSALTRIKALWQKDENGRWPSADVRNSPDWLYRAGEAMRRIEDFHAAEKQDEIDAFHQKVALWRRLVDIAPPSDVGSGALTGLMQTLHDPAVLRQAPAEWVSEVEPLLTYARIFRPQLNEVMESLGVQRKDAPYTMGSEIARLLLESPSPLLNAYGRLADIEARKPVPE